MEKNILLAEQKSVLEEKLIELKNKQKSIIDSLNNGNKQDVKIGEFSDTIDTMALVECRRINSEMAEIKNVLNQCTVVENENSEVIKIGSTFTTILDFGDGIIEDSFTLVDSREGLKGNYISTDSPFGNCILEHSVFDNFEYNLYHQDETVRGMITGIDGIYLDDHCQNLIHKYKLLLEKRVSLMSRVSNKSLLKQIGLINIQISNYEMLMRDYFLKKEEKGKMPQKSKILI